MATLQEPILSAPIRQPLAALNAIFVAIVLVSAVAVPVIADDYWLSSIIIPTIVMGLAGIGLNLLFGYAGLVSLGSAAFMSIGAFATYNLLLRAPFLPLPVVLILAGLFAAAAGVLFGCSACRRSGSRVSISVPRRSARSSSSNGCSPISAGSPTTASR
jgi:branched-chain amino acid transport system permease protein